jgi:hypothetical protein
MFDSLDDILEQPTQVRSELTTNNQQEMTNFSSLEFEEVSSTPIEQEQEEEFDISPYNAEENAEILVELIDVVNIQTLTPLARWKLRKKLGGKTEVTRKQLLFEKKLSQSKLTEEEKRDIELYQAYLKDKAEIEKAIPYTEDEKKNLKQAAIPYLMQSKLKIGGGMAFWTQLAMIQGSRIMQVLTA